MKAEQLVNRIFAALFLMIGITAFVSAFFFGAYWHYYTAIVCSGLSILLFTIKTD